MSVPWCENVLTRPKSAGKVFFFARSPEAPSTTITVLSFSSMFLSCNQSTMVQLTCQQIMSFHIDHLPSCCFLLRMNDGVRHDRQYAFRSRCNDTRVIARSGKYWMLRDMVGQGKERVDEDVLKPTGFKLLFTAYDVADKDDSSRLSHRRD